MQTIQNTVIGALETVKNKLEEADSSVAERKKVFGADGTEELEEADQT
jgi:hypothetical protein